MPTDPAAPLDLDEIETRLRERRAELQDRLAGFAAPPERGSDLGFGKRVGDGTLEAVDRLNAIGVGNTLTVTVERIDRALARLADGTYGTCEVCGRDIPAARLRAAPESTVCVHCPRPGL